MQRNEKRAKRKTRKKKRNEQRRQVGKEKEKRENTGKIRKGNENRVKEEKTGQKGRRTGGRKRKLREIMTRKELKSEKRRK